MAFTHREIAEKARQRVGASPAARLRYQSFVNDALQRIADTVPMDLAKRSHLLTSKGSVTATLTSGVADLATLVNASPFININRIRFGRVFLNSFDQPLYWLPDGETALLDDSLDTDFTGYWIEGNKLYTTDASLSGTLSLSVPFIPTLASLPNDLVSTLVDEVVAIAGGASGSQTAAA